MCQKAGFVSPRSSKIIVTKEKERRKRKSEEKKGTEEKKRMVALLVLTIATLKIVFDRKKPFDAKGLFGDDVIKNPARHISLSNYPYLFEKFSLLR